MVQEHLCWHIKYHYSSSDLACREIGADCQHVFAGLEELLGSVINIIPIPCTGDTSPLGLGFPIYTQTCSCVNTHRQYLTNTNTHTHWQPTLALSLSLRRPSETEADLWQSPDGLPAVCQSFPASPGPFIAPSLIPQFPLGPPLYLARCYMVPGEHNWMAFHSISVKSKNQLKPSSIFLLFGYILAIVDSDSDLVRSWLCGIFKVSNSTPVVFFYYFVFILFFYLLVVKKTTKFHLCSCQDYNLT